MPYPGMRGREAFGARGRAGAFFLMRVAYTELLRLSRARKVLKTVLRKALQV
jgi:hypothetical protein